MLSERTSIVETPFACRSRIGAIRVICCVLFTSRSESHPETYKMSWNLILFLYRSTTPKQSQVRFPPSTELSVVVLTLPQFEFLPLQCLTPAANP